LQRPVGDVREVADRRCDEVESASHSFHKKAHQRAKGKGPGSAEAFERKSNAVGTNKQIGYRLVNY